MFDYYRSEPSQAMVGYATGKIIKTQGVEEDLTNFDQHGGTDQDGFFSVSRQQMMGSQYRGSRQTLSNGQRVMSRASRDVDYFNSRGGRPQFSIADDVSNGNYMYTSG